MLEQTPLELVELHEDLDAELYLLLVESTIRPPGQVQVVLSGTTPIPAADAPFGWPKPRPGERGCFVKAAWSWFKARSPPVVS